MLRPVRVKKFTKKLKKNKKVFQANKNMLLDCLFITPPPPFPKVSHCQKHEYIGNTKLSFTQIYQIQCNVFLWYKSRFIKSKNCSLFKLFYDHYFSCHSFHNYHKFCFFFETSLFKVYFWEEKFARKTFYWWKGYSSGLKPWLREQAVKDVA